MKVLKAEGDRGSEKPTLISWKWFHRSEVGEKFTTIDQFQNQVKVAGVLSQSFEIHNEWMIELRMYQILIIDMINLLSLDNLPFLEEFKGDILSIFLMLGHFDLAKAAYSSKHVYPCLRFFRSHNPLILVFLVLPPQPSSSKTFKILIIL